MTTDGEEPAPRDEPSAPWERAERWSGPDEAPGSAADSPADSPAGDPNGDPNGDTAPRRRRLGEDAAGAVPASELIAALRGLGGGATPQPGELGPDPSQPEQQPLSPDTNDYEGPAHHDAPHRSWLIAGRSLVAIVAAVVLVVAGTAWIIKSRANAALADNAISALDPDDTNISTSPPPADAEHSAAAEPAAAAPRSYAAENVLLLGTDSRHTKADIALGGPDDSPGGSDVVMVAHFSADRSHVTVISIPRHTYLDAPDCKAWNAETGEQLDYDYSSPYSLWRITSAYAAGGPACSVKAVQQFTGLRIDRVIVIDFAGFAAVVDALGGVTVNACRPVIDANLGTVLPTAGEQHLDGKQALELVRARKVQGDTTSDLARIRRQQKVLAAMLREITSAGVLLNPLKLDSVLQSFVQNVQTDNVSLDDLLEIAQSFGNLDPRRVTFFTLPTWPDSNGVGLHPTDDAEDIWQALRADRPLPGEVTDAPEPSPTPRTSSSMSRTSTSPSRTPAPPVTSTVTKLVTSTPAVPSQTVSVAPSDVDIQVVNVAGRPGVATLGMNRLLPLGFAISDPSDLLLIDGRVEDGITVEYSSPHRADALTVAAAVPGATLHRVDGLGSRVRLLLGSSFDGTVRDVSAGAPIPSSLSTTPSPVVSTVVSTTVSTPPAATESSSGPGAPEHSTSEHSTSGHGASEHGTSGSTAATVDRLPSSDITSVNAATAGCL